MAISEEHDGQLREVALDAIQAMGSVAATAQAKRDARGPYSDGVEALASAPNRMAFGLRADAGKELASIRDANTATLERLMWEPIVARVRVEDEGGEHYTLYIARAAPPTGTGLTVASYHTDVGRLAELEPGDVKLVNFRGKKRRLAVREVALVHPLQSDGWDGRENRVTLDDGTRYTIPSLRGFTTAPVDHDAEDPLEKLLAGEASAAAVFEGFRRTTIERMGLRDQPILDRYQGDIFRLPIDRRLAITGPAGTGKTTTLIKRLGQKLAFDELPEDEQVLVKQAAALGLVEHARSWVMYTPTELLKLYVKEAFGREGIAVADERIRTWNEDRRRLGRNVLGILRSERAGLFTLEERASLLQPGIDARSREYFEAFQTYFQERTVQRIRGAIQALMALPEENVASLARTLWSQFRGRYSLEDFFAMSQDASGIAAIVKSRREGIERTAKRWLNDLYRADAQVIHRINDAVQRFQEEDDDEDDDDDLAEEEAAPLPTNRTAQALKAFQRAMEVKARALVGGREIGEGTRAALVLDAAKELPPEDELRALGRELRVLRDLRAVANPVRNIYTRIPSVFQQFRRAALEKGEWYQPDASGAIRRRRITTSELDAVTLLMLRNARQIIERARPGELDRDQRLVPLTSVRGEWRNQVLVDEFTDFSPVQLACMFELSTPPMRSFFVCGDFRQRVTTWGARTREDLRWIARDLNEQPISVAYRQSRRLTEFAAKLSALAGEQEAVTASVPERVGDDGVPPVLAENVSGPALAEWLAGRVREVERASGRLPSIAVFVDGEGQVEPLAEALGEQLAARNIPVLACPQGRVIGNDNAVRVFDIAHIKGLEFEAVFFVGVDEVANRAPDLFDKYLYVGSTRAATYLGISCVGPLPSSLEPLRPEFGTTWFSS